MSKDNDGGYRVSGGLSERIGSIRITEQRISRKVRTKEIGFISRRTSYRTIRVNKRGNIGVIEVVEDFFG